MNEPSAILILNFLYEEFERRKELFKFYRDSASIVTEENYYSELEKRFNEYIKFRNAFCEFLTLLKRDGLPYADILKKDNFK